MGGYFNSWRRKVGVATLLMACVAMGGWVRSQSTADMIVFSTGDHAFHSLWSEASQITWQRSYDPFCVSTGNVPLWLCFGVPSIGNEKPTSHGIVEYPTWQWRLWGFSLDKYPFDYTGTNPHEVFWTIPYWCLVFPFTLASLYLLLIKPRPTKTKNVENHLSLSGVLRASIGIIKDAMHSWRGRGGLVTLAMTLFFAFWWLRSFFFFYDFINFQSFVEFPIEEGAFAGIGTERHSLVCMKFDEITVTLPPSPSETKDIVKVGFNDANDPTPISKPVCLIYASFKIVPFLAIPFWSILLPLSLLSAWLLLSTPTEAISEKVV